MMDNIFSYAGLVCGCGGIVDSWISKLFGEDYPCLFFKCSECNKQGELHKRKFGKGTRIVLELT